MLISDKLGIESSGLNYDFGARKNRRNVNNSLGMNKAIAKENLQLLKKYFDSSGLDFYLLFGTLLGIYRDGDLIEYDEDIDVGIMPGQEDKLLIAIKLLLDAGFEIIRNTAEDDLITIIRRDEYIDIAILKYDDTCNTFKYQNNIIHARYFKSRKFVTYSESQFLIPCHVRSLLIYWYGIFWFIPQKGFPAWTENYNGPRKLFSALKRLVWNYLRQ